MVVGLRSGGINCGGRAAGFLAAAAVGYLLGTAPSADIAAKLVTGGDIDLRQHGSKNPGGLNAARLLGKRAGALVIAADMAKGVAAAGVGGVVAGGRGAHLAATSAVVGHCYPVWSAFQGGKGVGTSFGQCLATFPVYAPLDMVVAGMASKLGKAGSQARFGTTVASVCWVAAAMLWWRRGWPNLWGPRPSAWTVLSATATSAIVLHRFAVAERAAVGAVVGEAAP